MSAGLSSQEESECQNREQQCGRFWNGCVEGLAGGRSCTEVVAPVDVALGVAAVCIAPHDVIGGVDDAVGVVITTDRGSDEIQDNIVSAAADVADGDGPVEASAGDAGALCVKVGRNAIFEEAVN